MGGPEETTKNVGLQGIARLGFDLSDKDLNLIVEAGAAFGDRYEVVYSFEVLPEFKPIWTTSESNNDILTNYLCYPSPYSFPKFRLSPGHEENNKQCNPLSLEFEPGLFFPLEPDIEGTPCMNWEYLPVSLQKGQETYIYQWKAPEVQIDQWKALRHIREMKLLIL